MRDEKQEFSTLGKCLKKLLVIYDLPLVSAKKEVEKLLKEVGNQEFLHLLLICKQHFSFLFSHSCRLLEESSEPKILTLLASANSASDDLNNPIPAALLKDIQARLEGSKRRNLTMELFHAVKQGRHEEIAGLVKDGADLLDDNYLYRSATIKFAGYNKLP